MAFEQRSPGNFNFQSPVNPAAEAALMQRKAMFEQEQERAREKDAYSAAQDAVKSASELVSGMVERSKSKQKQDFINTLANSLGEKAAVNPLASFQKPVSSMVPPTTNVASFNPAQQDAIKSAVQLKPEPFIDALAKVTIPGASTGGFGNPIAVRNAVTGERSFAQAGKDGSFILANGQPFTADWQREYAPSSETFVYEDPTTGKKTLLNRRDAKEVAPLAEEAGDQNTPFVKRSLKEKDAIRQTRDKILQDPLLESSQVALNNVGNFKTILDQDLSVATGSLRSLAARVFAGEKGVLTDKDVERVSGSSDVANQFRTLVNKIYSGKPTDQDYREFQSIISSVTDRASEQYQTAVQAGIENLSMEFGLTDKEARTLLRYKDPAKIMAIKGRGAVEDPDRRQERIATPAGDMSNLPANVSAAVQQLKQQGLGIKSIRRKK